MIDVLRYLANAVGSLLGLFAAAVWYLHDPGQPYIAKTLALGIPAAALLGWMLYSYYPPGLAQDLLSLLGEIYCDLFGARFSVRCLVEHDWTGCQCTRCGKKRDQDHDWETRDCFPHCRRCHAYGDLVHSWEGCRCRICGCVRNECHAWDVCMCKVCRRTRHEWRQGVCTRCGLRCDHPETTFSWDIIHSGQIAHAAKTSVCGICRSQLAVIYRSTPRRLAGAGGADAQSSGKPSACDLAQDPLWLELQGCWRKAGTRELFRSSESEELLRWHHSDRREQLPSLLLAHKEALEALVTLEQVDVPVAAGLQLAFDQAILHWLRSGASCYKGHPPIYEWRDNLSEQTQALCDMDKRGVLDPGIMRRASACIARDIRLLRVAQSPEQFGLECDEAGAARVLVELLSQQPQPPMSEPLPASASPP